MVGQMLIASLVVVAFLMGLVIRELMEFCRMHRPVRHPTDSRQGGNQ